MVPTSLQYIPIDNPKDIGDALNEILHIFNSLLCDFITMVLFFFRKYLKLECVLAFLVLHEFKKLFVIIFFEFFNVPYVFIFEGIAEVFEQAVNEVPFSFYLLIDETVHNL
jgi:hypothetical protein